MQVSTSNEAALRSKPNDVCGVAFAAAVGAKGRAHDVVVLAELPDDHAALTTAIAGVIPGHLKASKTTKLFTVEETMEAMRTAGSLAFQGPSRG